MKPKTVNEIDAAEARLSRGCGGHGAAAAPTVPSRARRGGHRCRTSLDPTGEFADIAVGDPWYLKIGPGGPGRSMFVAPALRGREFLRKAIADGARVAEKVDPMTLPASQPNLPRARGDAGMVRCHAGEEAAA